MGRIRVLDDSLINRIAAGEVVERPASVVKELVENSLDARASLIEIDLLAGGRQRVQVADDGCGMDRDDALLALERHATSKLGRIDDLSALRTLGFRGEALASIAAVSKLTLTTAVVDGTGTEVEADGGRIRAVRAAGLRRGTTVRVERLFFNTPARRKFLKAESTELTQCLRWLTRYALAAPACGFRVEQAGRRLLEAPPVESAEARLVQLHGSAFVERLLPFESDAPGLRVHGFAGRPVESLPRRDAQYAFVNGRAVTDRTLTHAVSQAYGNTVPAGRHPAIFLWIDLEPSEVDVNVHPQKTEVRFLRAAVVHDLVRDAIGRALSLPTAVPSLADLRPEFAHSGPLPGLRESTLRYLEGSAHQSTPARTGGAAEPGRGPSSASSPGAEGEASLLAAPRSPSALAQLRDSYILASDGDALVIVDQHAAHERVLFERYLHAAEAGEVATQRLAFPVNVELPSHELALVEEELDELRRLGFELEPFGANTVRIDALPAVASEDDPAALLREMLGEASRSRSTATDVAAIRLRVVTTAACRAAIKINHPLARPSMQHLLDDLYATSNPTTCPHGRPVVFRIPLAEIERGFRRR